MHFCVVAAASAAKTYPLILIQAPQPNKCLAKEMPSVIVRKIR